MGIMVLSERQEDILQKAVFEYINRAEPISSGWIEERYGMACSPATIRAEMLALNEKGYLEQPYTSSGRVPTDKGYRFFVDGLAAGQNSYSTFIEGDVYEMGKKLAEMSSSLIVFSVPQRRFLWKEGWEIVLQAPEFERKGKIGSFTKFLRDVEQGIRNIRFKKDKRVEVYIGKENPFSNEDDFSIILSGYSAAGRQQGVFAFVGPKRMSYDITIGLVHSLHSRVV